MTVAMLIGMAVAAIWLSVALPSWRQQAQRAREEMLIFYGEQWARGIVLYQNSHQGASPASLDMLVEQRFVRKKWKDPVTKDDFVPVSLDMVQTNQGGITGVRSKSSAASIKIYQQQQRHDLWRFDARLYRNAHGMGPAPGAKPAGPSGR